MENRTVSFSIETFIKRSWPLIVAGAVLVIGATAFLLYIALRGAEPSAPSSAATSTVPGGVATTTAAMVPRLLDGVPVQPDQAALQPFAVMVENSVDARPLSGPARANLVIEAPVEGGITRFMLVFDATTTVDQIGPVRSARPYYVELADALHAVYAHVGGSPEALQKAQSLPGFRNVDEFFHAKYFWRSAKRVAPHNAYTRSDLLRNVAADRGWATSTFVGWQYATSSERGDVKKVSVPYLGGYAVSWEYRVGENVYDRWQAGKQQRDADGALVTVKNVVVLATDASVLDDVGRLRLRTTGSGKAVLFRSGKRQEIAWHRQNGSWFTFKSVDGSDVVFEPGTTWLSFVTSLEELP